jgi:hypothetical protein
LQLIRTFLNPLFFSSNMSEGVDKPAEMYGITRGPFSWKVGLKRQGVALFKRFTFNIHGGEAAALMRALAWRDDMTRKHLPVTRAQRADKLRRNNKTGVSGVTCQLGPDGEPRLWSAKTYISRVLTLNKSFSVGRYGKEAKLLAISERHKQLQQMSGLAFVHVEEAVVRSSPPRLLPADCPPPITKGEVLRRSNRSGVPGVHRRKSSESSRGNRWVASTYLGGGKYLTKSFSVIRHGEERAKALAIEERQRQLRQAPEHRL